MQEENHDFPDIWTALLILGLLFGLEVLLSGTFYDAGARFAPGDPKGWVVVVLSNGIIFSLLMHYKNLSYSQLFNRSGLSVPKMMGKVIMPIFIMSCGSAFLGIKASQLLMHLFPPSGSEADAFDRFFSGGPNTVIILCIVAPLIEEMLFRGLFLRSFLHSYNPIRAILLSAILFGIAHLNVHQLVIASILGIFLGWLYYVTGSLWPGVLAHALHNAGVYLYLQFPDGPDFIALGGAPIHSGRVLMLAVAIFLLGFLWLLKVAPALSGPPEIE